MDKGSVVMYLSHKLWSSSSVCYDVLYKDKVCSVTHPDMDWLTGPLVKGVESAL